LPGLD
jgi:hypothetical protein